MKEKKIIKAYPEINGIYRHNKGGLYKVLMLAKHSETNEVLVIYKSVHFGSFHARPLRMWYDKIKLKSNKLPVSRFAMVAVDKDWI